MRECCQRQENLSEAPWGHPDETLLVCQVCGAKHYTHHARPMALGVTGAPMGDTSAALAHLSQDDLAALSDARAAVDRAKERQRRVIRRVLAAHGLDPDGRYLVQADGRVTAATAVIH